MDRAPFDALERLAKGANIRIERFFDGTQSFAASLFLRRSNMERQTEFLSAFAWPIATVADCAGNPIGVLGAEHHVSSVPVGIFLIRRENADPAQYGDHLAERGQLSQWLFRNSLISLVGDACCIADSIGALLMRAYLNPRQPQTRCGIKETYDWAKDQPSTNVVAKQIEKLLLGHAGANAWRVCLTGIRNDFVHGTNERVQFLDGRSAKFYFSPSDGGKAAQQQFVGCFGPDTDIDFAAFSRTLCDRVDRLICDFTDGSFGWPALT